MRLLAEWWREIWPNLAANVLWIPVVYFWNHWHLKKLLDRHHERIVAVMKKEGA